MGQSAVRWLSLASESPGADRSGEPARAGNKEVVVDSTTLVIALLIVLLALVARMTR